MIWLTWRQFRAQAAITYGAVAVLALLLAATGPGLLRQYHADPARFLTVISGADRTLYIVGWLGVLALPVLVGMFWGAPLVTRELDAHTQLLTWTLTTRWRWLAAKLGVIGLAAVIAAGLASLALSWWASPIDTAIAAAKGLPAPGLLVFPRLSREVFDSRGVVPVGYTLFAFVLGVTIGTVVRRTLTAVALVLGIFVVVQLGMSIAVRPLLNHPRPAGCSRPAPCSSGSPSARPPACRRPRTSGTSGSRPARAGTRLAACSPTRSSALLGGRTPSRRSAAAGAPAASVPCPVASGSAHPTRPRAWAAGTPAAGLLSSRTHP
jgi:hypothetical protein